MAVDVGESERAGHRLQRRLCVLLFLVSLAFWGLVFSRSVLALDDMGLILRGQTQASSLLGIRDMLHHDIVEQNGRIADSTLSLVATAGEPAARAYFALACALLFPTALIWLRYLIPRSAVAVLPFYALPVVAASLPWLLLALDRRLISQLVLFGAASSGYFTGLFLVTVGLMPALRVLSGVRTGPRAVVLSAVPLFVGVMFHEVLAALLLGCALAVGFLAVRLPDRRRALLPLAMLMAASVVLKASTPGLWSRAADSDQRPLADASLFARTDTAIAFGLVAFVPLLGYVGVSLALSLRARGESLRRQVWVLLTAFALVVLSLGYRLAGGYPVSGLVTALAVAVVIVTAASLRHAQVEPVELVALAATVTTLCVPVYGGLLPGRAWFFGEFLALLLATGSLVRSVSVLRNSLALSPGQPLAAWRLPGSQFLAVALLGSGVVVAPVLGYELLDKVNDNHAWRAYVADEVRGQGDGSVEIPWTYPWDDMRPSFAVDEDHEPYEGLVRDFFDISDETEVVWNGSVSWTTG